MVSALKFVLYIAVIYFLFVIISTIQNSNKVSDNEMNFFDIKNAISNYLDNNGSKIDINCRQEGKVKYVQEGKVCKTSIGEILSCKNGLVQLGNGLKGKNLKLYGFTFKCIKK